MRHFILISFFIGLIISCGNLEQTIDLTLPDHDEKIIVESYIRPGQFYDLTLSKTTPFFDVLNLEDPDALQNILVSDARVFIKSNKREIELIPMLTVNEAGQIVNYTSDKKVDQDETAFELLIELSDGRAISSQCALAPKVKVDSVVIEKEEKKQDGKYRLLSYSLDADSMSTNYYRRTMIVKHNNIDTTKIYQDFVFDDELNSTALIANGTSYDFGTMDTVVNIFTHINTDYGEFLNSVNGSISSSVAPIGQPGTIFGNMNEEFASGIFTAFNESRDTFVIVRAETLIFE